MKTKQLILVLAVMLGSFISHAQIGIGTTEPDPSAELDVTSPLNNKGFLPPRLTSSERDGIANPAEGLTIYNTDNKCLETWNGSDWISLCDGSVVTTPTSPGLGPITDCSTPGFIPPYLTANQTIVNDVTSVTGEIWMDRNLGAYTVARAVDDCYAYGNLYQWHRSGDGHENRNSTTYNGTRPEFVTDSGPWDGLWIASDSVYWTQLFQNNGWTSTGGPTNPCPTGYRVPSRAEFLDEIANYPTPDLNGAFNSDLVLSAGGIRLPDGTILEVGATAAYWTHTTAPGGFEQGERAIAVSSAGGGTGPFVFTNNELAPYGQSVRCIKD